MSKYLILALCEQIIKYNQEVIEKLFNMMEKMTERIVQMENII